MATWQKLEEVKPSEKYGPGSYIGWWREHPNIHQLSTEPYVYKKTSLVQIGGHPGRYEVLAQTVIHSILEGRPGVRGTVIFKETHGFDNIGDARGWVDSQKTKLSRQFDGITYGAGAQQAGAKYTVKAKSSSRAKSRRSSAPGLGSTK